LIDSVLAISPVGLVLQADKRKVMTRMMVKSRRVGRCIFVAMIFSPNDISHFNM
jgi:hypothetical protein